jgi:hypothetical protein
MRFKFRTEEGKLLPSQERCVAAKQFNHAGVGEVSAQRPRWERAWGLYGSLKTSLSWEHLLFVPS